MVRSNGGLYYDTFEEFAEALYALEAAGPISGPFGQNGREYFRRHYAWPVIERKYLDMFAELQRSPAGPPLEPLPGWVARRHRDRPPAAEVVNAVKGGPVIH